MRAAARRSPATRRRREVARRLALPRPGRKAFPRKVGDEDASSQVGGESVSSLAAVLRDLGPAFAACGRDLSTRRELLPPKLCRELAELAPSPEPGPTASPVLPEPGRLTEVEPEPRTLTMTTALYRARLAPDGAPVRLLLPRADFLAALDEDLEHLPLLLGPLATLAPGATREGLGRALAETAARLRRAADLSIAAGAQEMLALDARRSHHLAASRPLAELSGEGILAFEDVGQRGLERWFERFPAGTAALGSLARRLCRVWIRQVLAGRLFPLEPRPEHLEVDPEGSILFRGGAFVWPEAGCQELLRNYLDAVLAADPDAALEALCRDSEPPDAELRRRFRLGLPEPEAPEAGLRQAEELVLHWRLLAEAGRGPGEEIRAFFRGLVELERTARRLAPGRDAFREALERELAPGGGGLGGALDPGLWFRRLEPYGELLATLPARLEEAAASLAEGRAGIRLEARESTGSRTGGGTGAGWTYALPLLLAAALLLAAGGGPGPPWLEAAAAASLAALGGWWLGRGGTG